MNIETIAYVFLAFLAGAIGGYAFLARKLSRLGNEFVEVRTQLAERDAAQDSNRCPIQEAGDP